MFIPPPQQRQNPIMGLLGQLALMKVQHDWSMEERQMQLEAKKLEQQEAKAEVRSKSRSEAMMQGAEFSTPTGPVAGPEAYQQPEGSQYDPYYGQNVKPPPDLKPAFVDGKVVGHIDRRGALHYLPQDKTVKQGTLLEQYDAVQNEFKEGRGPDPGPLNNWLVKQKQAGAVRMGTEEKIDLAEKNKVVDARAFIQTPNFVEKCAEVAAKVTGLDDWKDAPKWKKEELTFRAADEAIKNAYKDEAVYFGEADGVQGWFAIDKKTKKRKLIRQWGNAPKSAKTTETVRSH
jgi:hypothetical protein